MSYDWPCQSTDHIILSCCIMPLTADKVLQMLCCVRSSKLLLKQRNTTPDYVSSLFYTFRHCRSKSQGQIDAEPGDEDSDVDTEEHFLTLDDVPEGIHKADERICSHHYIEVRRSSTPLGGS